MLEANVRIQTLFAKRGMSQQICNASDFRFQNISCRGFGVRVLDGKHWISEFNTYLPDIGIQNLTFSLQSVGNHSSHLFCDGTSGKWNVENASMYCNGYRWNYLIQHWIDELAKKTNSSNVLFATGWDKLQLQKLWDMNELYIQVCFIFFNL